MQERQSARARKKTKIAWFGWPIWKEGGGFYTAGYLIVECLLKRGHFVYYFGYHPYQPLPDELKNYPDFRMSALTVSKVTRRVFDHSPHLLFLILESLVMFLKQLMFYPQFRIAQAKNRFDVIYFWGHPEIFPFLPRWLGTPVVIHLQGNTLGEIRAFKRDKKLVYQSEGRLRYYIIITLMWIKNLFQRIGIKNASQLISPSQLVASEIARENKIDPHQIKTIPYPVDLERFTPSVKEEKKNNYVLLYAGRISYRKGINVLLEALIKVKNNIPNILVEIVGAASVVPHIANLFDDPRIRTHLVVQGKVSYDKMAELIQRSDAVVVPSTYEPFGMIVAESLACGKPVILSNKVGAKDLVTTYSALIFRANSSSELAWAMVTMRKRIEDSTLPFSIRRSVEDRVSVNHVTSQILDFLANDAKVFL